MYCSLPESLPLLAVPRSVWVSSAFHCCHGLVCQNLHLPSWIPLQSQSALLSGHLTHKTSPAGSPHNLPKDRRVNGGNFQSLKTKCREKYFFPDRKYVIKSKSKAQALEATVKFSHDIWKHNSSCLVPVKQLPLDDNLVGWRWQWACRDHQSFPGPVGHIGPLLQPVLSRWPVPGMYSFDHTQPELQQKKNHMERINK